MSAREKEEEVHNERNEQRNEWEKKSEKMKHRIQMSRLMIVKTSDLLISLHLTRFG